MKIVYHEKFKTVYSSDPASEPGRIECIIDELEQDFDFFEPEPVSIDDLNSIHTMGHIENIKNLRKVYGIAILAAGAAVKAGEIALTGKPAFGLIRPPGHHASRDSSWGFCYFNNIAMAVHKLLIDKKISSAIIVDFDLHFGDGTANIFSGSSAVSYYHMPGQNSIADLSDFLSSKDNYDVIAVSAGFDRHINDWGRMLTTQDYERIGAILKEQSMKCANRRFAVLEGGYNHKVLGKNVAAFIKGFK